MKNSNKNDLIKKLNSPLDETNYYNPEALIQKTKGIYVWIEGEENPYIDLLMGYSSTNFGHVNDKIVEIVTEAIKSFDNITSFNSLDKIELSKKLIDLLPFPNDRLVYYPVGGTKAVDAAIKLARAHTKKDTILSFVGGFHGYSYAAMSVTDDRFVEKMQFGINTSNKTFDFPDRKNLDASIVSQNILDEIEEYLQKNGDSVAAILFEPIQGAAGFIIPPDGFLTSLVELARKHNIITICDEIQTGVCRTGSFYYINQIKINPDIILLGKSLAGGYYPLSAVIARRELFESVNFNKPGFDSTFANNLLAMNIANRVIDYIHEENIYKKVDETGKAFLSELKKIEKFPFIRDVDGIGMAFSYRVQSPSGNIKDSAKLAKLIRKQSFDNHLIIQTAGVNGNYMKLAPSLLITPKEMKNVFSMFNSTLEEVANIITD